MIKFTANLPPVIAHLYTYAPDGNPHVIKGRFYPEEPRDEFIREEQDSEK